MHVYITAVLLRSRFQHVSTVCIGMPPLVSKRQYILQSGYIALRVCKTAHKARPRVVPLAIAMALKASKVMAKAKAKAKQARTAASKSGVVRGQKETPSLFVPGDAVYLVGLEAFAQLNGERGILLAYDAESKRWQVDLENGIGIKNVLLSNLSKVPKVESVQSVPASQPQATPQRSTIEVAKRRLREKTKETEPKRRCSSKDSTEGPEGLPISVKSTVVATSKVDTSFSSRFSKSTKGVAKAPKHKIEKVPVKGSVKRDAEEEDEDDDDLQFDADELEGEEEVSDFSEEEAPEDDNSDEQFDWEPVGALEMPQVWSSCGPKPGEEAFAKYASNCLAKAALGSSKSPFAGLRMRLHQESAAFLLHPESPVKRLLVDHATGTGKTLIMLRMLDNYFDDDRPKVAIFPKDAVCDNFYQELLKWPTRWRHFFCFLKPAEASIASGAKDWRRKKSDVWDINNERSRAEAKARGVRLEKIISELTESIRQALEMKHAIHGGKVRAKVARAFLEEHPDAPMPRAPLRAFRYTTAGGGAAVLGRDGWPRSPILKVGFDPAELNPYSGKVVIMDECHNLVRPNQVYEDQLGHLRNLLHEATRTVLAGFTGTPVGNDAAEGRQLLDIIKGKTAGFCGDEGFVSCFHARASSDFPKEVPVQGIPDGVLHDSMLPDLVKMHSLHGEALKRYLLKEVEFMITPRLMRLPEEKKLARLSNYCNLHVFHGSYTGAKRTALLENVKDYAPKFHGVAKAIAKNKEKAVVMLSRQTGYRALLEILQKTGRKRGFKVATLKELSDFNDAKRNLRGERFRVMVAETSQAGEGIQFRHVRRLHLVEVPARHSELVQRASRCVRMGGHEGLPMQERELAIEVHLTQLPSFLRKGPGSFIYRELLNAKEVMSTPGSRLEEATAACMKELKKRDVKTLLDFREALQADDGADLMNLMTETVLEILGNTNSAPARPLAVSMWQLRKRDDDLVLLEKNLLKQATVKTADHLLLERLMDKSVELLGPLEAMRLGAIDRDLLAPLGDPPKAPPPRINTSAEPAPLLEDDDDMT